jgi:nucleoside-diphosphate-sugar epimerase
MTHIKRAVLTGLTGFIGSNLAAGLLSRGIEVHAIVRKRPFNDAGLHNELITIHEYDGSIDSVLNAFNSARPDVVFHLASNFIAEHQSTDIAGLIESNVLFGTQLLEASAIIGAPRFINTGSSWQHYGATDHTAANLYAATKTAFESIVSYYAEAKQLKAISLIIFDTYGAGDTRRKLIPLLKNACRSQQPLAMSPGEQQLDLVYIDDVVAAFMHAAELSESLPPGHKVYALSSGDPVSIKKLVERINALVETPLLVTWGGRPYRAREVMHPWNRGVPLPGWKTIISLEEGLKKVFSY